MTDTRPPSERQVRAAEFIAATLGLSVPSERSSRAYWSFVNAHIERARAVAGDAPVVTYGDGTRGPSPAAQATEDKSADTESRDEGTVETETPATPDVPDEREKTDPPESWRGTRSGWRRHLMEIGRLPWDGGESRDGTTQRNKSSSKPDRADVTHTPAFGRWTDASVDLPPEETPVLVSWVDIYGARHNDGVACRRWGTWVWYDGDVATSEDEVLDETPVTHWMPCPGDPPGT